MLTFQELQRRLIALLRYRISSGEMTERGLAKKSGISQPHIHNVLKGKRSFSVETADAVLHTLHLSVLDLLEPGDSAEWRGPR